MLCINLNLNVTEIHSKLCTSLLFAHFLSMPMLYGIIAPSTRYTNLGKIQNEAARIVTRATKLVFINSLYLETGWEYLASRRKKKQ